MTKKANAAVEAVLNNEQSDGGKGTKRKYTHYTGGQRAKIAKYMLLNVGIWLPSGTLRVNFHPLVRAQ